LGVLYWPRRSTILLIITILIRFLPPCFVTVGTGTAPAPCASSCRRRCLRRLGLLHWSRRVSPLGCGVPPPPHRPTRLARRRRPRGQTRPRGGYAGRKVRVKPRIYIYICLFIDLSVYIDRYSATSAAPPCSPGAPPLIKRADSPAQGSCWPKGVLWLFGLTPGVTLNPNPNPSS